MPRTYKNGIDRMETARLPPRVEDYIGADNPVRAINAYVEMLVLAELGFDRTEPNRTAAGQPAFAPATMLKLYLLAR
jgi:hypothetical protein